MIGRSSALQKETTALIARMSPKPSSYRAQLMDNLIRALKDAGVWTRLDFLYVTAAADVAASRVNWVSSSYTATAVGTVLFTANIGVQGASQVPIAYLNSNYAPDGTKNFKLNDAHMAVWASSLSTNTTEIGDGTGARTLIPNTTASQAFVDLSASPAVTFATNNVAGLSLITRADGTNERFSKNGGLFSTAAAATVDTGLNPGALFRVASGGRLVSAASIGAGLTDAQITAYYNALNTYLTAIQQTEPVQPVDPTAPPPVVPPPAPSTSAKYFTATGSLWNTPIAANPTLDPNSAGFCAQLANSGFGTQLNQNLFTVNVAYADATTPRVTVTNPDNWTLTGVPLTPDSRGTSDSDSQLVVVDAQQGKIWQFFGAANVYATHTAAAVGVFDISQHGWWDPSIAPGGPWTGRSSNASYMAGLILPEELNAGVIPHAIAVGLDAGIMGTIPWLPAKTTDGTVPGGVPNGARLQLDPNLDLTPFNLGAHARIVAVALQKYGAFIVERGSGFALAFQSSQNQPSNPYAGMDFTGINGSQGAWIHQHWRMLAPVAAAFYDGRANHPEMTRPGTYSVSITDYTTTNGQPALQVPIPAGTTNVRVVTIGRGANSFANFDPTNGTTNFGGGGGAYSDSGPLSAAGHSVLYLFIPPTADGSSTICRWDTLTGQVISAAPAAINNTGGSASNGIGAIKFSGGNGTSNGAGGGAGGPNGNGANGASAVGGASGGAPGGAGGDQGSPGNDYGGGGGYSFTGGKPLIRVTFS